MTTPPLSYDVWSQDRRQRITHTLDGIVKHLLAITPQKLIIEAMAHSVLNGGKRIRGLLVYAAAELVDGAQNEVDYVAAAVELVHAFSLVHDDLPCMDDDKLRRGQPTTHVLYGEAQALLAGDAMQSLAFEVLAMAPFSNCANQLEALRVLAHAIGGVGMAGGQSIDIAVVQKKLDQEALEAMHKMKTGALLRGSVVLGALTSRTPLSANLANDLHRFGEAIGLAFQIVDDILDDTSSSASKLGKTPGKDKLNGKPNFVSLLGVDASKQYARQLLSQAMDALHHYEGAYRLGEIAQYIVQRDY